jgi:Na+/proline symporter
MKMATPVAHTPDDDGAHSRLERASWFLVLAFYVPTKALLSPLKRWAPKKIHDVARVFLDGVTWLGIWFLIHDIMVARTNWSSDRERDAAHRAFTAYLLLSLFAALGAVAIFFIMNGYLHDQFLNDPSSN